MPGAIRESWRDSPTSFPLLSREVGGGESGSETHKQMEAIFSHVRKAWTTAHQGRAPCHSPGSGGPKATGSRARCDEAFVYLKMLETQESISEWRADSHS